MRTKFFKNWVSSLKYKFSKFGLNKYSVLKSGSDEKQENWIIKYGNFDKTNYRGLGEKVAVLDTGVDPSHKEIKNKIISMCFIEGYEDPFDFSNHGTFIIGEIISNSLGISPEANCLSAKVLHGDGRDSDIHTFEKGVYKAILYSIENDYGVISMSFGSPHKSSLINEALSEAVNKGIIPVAASGNEGLRGSPYKSYPASFENCISVSSANEYNLPSWYSTAGQGTNVLEQPEICISGKRFHYGILTNNKYGIMTGTSISCPIVAGLALLWREKRKKEKNLPVGKDVLKQFREWLYENSYDSNKNGWDNELGFGVLILKPWESL